MRLSVTAYDAIETVPERVWDALRLADSLFVSRDWTMALRRSNPAVPVQLWVVEDDDGPAAAVPVHVYPGPPARRTYDIWSLHADTYVPVDREALQYVPHAIIGTRNGQLGGFLHRADVPAGALTKLLDAVRDGFAGAVLTMLYVAKDVVEALGPGRDHWETEFLDAIAHLEVPADGALETFIASARSRKTRQRLRHESAGFRQLPSALHIEDPDSIDDLAALLAPLAVNLNLKHGQPTTAATMEAYISSIARSGLQPMLFVGGTIEEPQSFSLAVRDDNLMSVRLAGFNYTTMERQQNPTEYARLTIHEPLRLALQNGSKRVDLGVGTLHAKLLRGASVTPVYSVCSIPPSLVKPRRATSDARLQGVLAQSPTILMPLAASWR